MTKILVVDDEEMLRDRLKSLLELDDYEVVLADSGLHGLDVYQKEKPDIIVSDIRMPGMDGIEFLKKIKELKTDVEVIMLTGHGGIESAIEAMKIGAFDYMNKPVNFDELSVNITRALEKRKLLHQVSNQQVQLLQAAKLAAVGELGAGVAHEMNQPLMAILTHIESLLMNDVVCEHPELETKITRMKDQFVRLSSIVKRMHDYSGSRKEGFSKEDVNRPVTDAVYLLGQQLKDHNIVVETDLEKELPHVFIDRYQVQDVIMNFMVNGRDAIDEKFKQGEGGRMKVVSRKLPGGQGVLVGSIENGIPVKEGTDNSIFNPFFTTKEPGKGTGLGLSVSYNIVKAHNGIIGFARLKDDRKIFYFALPFDKDKNLVADLDLPEQLKAEFEKL
ncbi:MAG: response regulator [Candidatus Omnitrophica bacterium]|nr:response regulator [Candidatus Omnitrophota bacterium]